MIGTPRAFYSLAGPLSVISLLICISVTTLHQQIYSLLLFHRLLLLLFIDYILIYHDVLCYFHPLPYYRIPCFLTEVKVEGYLCWKRKY